jgi:hypothetical protein
MLAPISQYHCGEGWQWGVVRFSARPGKWGAADGTSRFLDARPLASWMPTARILYARGPSSSGCRAVVWWQSSAVRLPSLAARFCNCGTVIATLRTWMCFLHSRFSLRSAASRLVLFGRG